MTKPTLIILAHPDLPESQINASWYAKLIEQAPCLRFHDLYRTYPHWNIDVAAEQALLEQHERIIFQFPMYWYNVPPMLKKWLDDVLEYGWAYGPGGNNLKDKEMGLAVSTGSPEAAYQSGGRVGHTLEEMLRPLEQTIRFVGARYLPIFALQGANQTIPERQLKDSATDYLAHLLAPHSVQ
jgi:putative NADPH-quinone reductase